MALVKDASIEFDCVYVLNSVWWVDWCRYVDIKPVYSKYLSGLVIDFDNLKGDGSVTSWLHAPKPEFVDNMAIVDDKCGFFLRKGRLHPVDDYVLLAPYAWRTIWSYYGGDCFNLPQSCKSVKSAPLVRQVILSGSVAASNITADARYSDVELYPFMVFAHWCTALGVATESAIEKVFCCNCCVGRSFNDAERRLCTCKNKAPSRNSSGPVAGSLGLVDKKICCADDVMHRLLERYRINYDETLVGTHHVSGQSHTQFLPNELRIWILRYDDPVTSANSARKRRTSEDEGDPDSARLDRSYLFTAPFYQSRSVGSSAYPKMHWDMLLPAERKLPLSVLHHGSHPCRIMIECRNIGGHWPTTEICSDPRPKWMNSLLDQTTVKRHKVGDRVVGRSPEGVWYPATVLAVDVGTVGTSEDKFVYLVRFERQTGLISLQPSTWECKVIAGHVAIVPNISWATPLLIENHLQPHTGQLPTPRTDGRQGSSSSNKQLISANEHLPAISRKSNRSNNDSAVEMPVLGTKSSKSNSVSPDNLDCPPSAVSGDEMDGLTLLRRYNLSKALRLIPFIDNCGYLDSEIHTHLSAKSVGPRIPSGTSTVSSGGSRSNAVRNGANTSALDGQEGLAASTVANTARNTLSIDKKKTGELLAASSPDPNGILGLWNLGNTCYMSAALHCLSHTPFLRMYFLSGRFRRDLNRTNIFGTGGRLTEEFATLLSMLWTTGGGEKVTSTNVGSPVVSHSGVNSNGSPRKPVVVNSGAQAGMVSNSGNANSIVSSPKYVTPRTFKRMLDKTKSQFEGNHQQDSQEFLSALLDALHEDLNKYDKKREEMSELQRKNGAVHNRAEVGVAGNSSGLPANGKYADSESLLVDIKRSNESFSATDSATITTKTRPGDDSELSPKTTGPDFTDNSPIELLDPNDGSGSDSKDVNSLRDNKSAVSNVAALGEAAWAKHIARNKSVMVDMFQGQQCTEVKCKECGNSSFTFDPFMSISLPLPKQHEITIVVTFLRKMPRIRALLSMVLEELDIEADLPLKFKTIAKNFVLTFRRCRSQVRMCINLPRLAEVSSLKQSICKALHDRAARTGDPSLAMVSPEYLLLSDCVQYTQHLLDYSRFLDDAEPLAQLLDTTNSSRDGFPTVLAWQLPKDMRYIAALTGTTDF
jgi:ubiquitin C-terminal hydrolase